ncbi:MAG TPA: hypothetical protein ENI46_03615 [Firmicutes bacterium]|nr:hypothetical protein [Bacillota bacterium]
MKPIRYLFIVFAILLALPVTALERKTEKVKAVWITRWSFKNEKQLKSLFDSLGEAGVNLVFFQVRGSCDALYQSAYEPWSAVLTGTLGKNPGWDPLAKAIEQGRRLGIEVHAWINVFPAWHVSTKGTPPPRSLPLHIMHVEPGWLARDRSGKVMSLRKDENKHNYAFLSPTHPSVQEHILSVVEDLVSKYEIDGLHLDYVRFPDSSYSYDYASRSAYRQALAETTISFADWRRDNLTEFVGAIAYTARLVRPGLKVSAAVWQILDRGRDYYFQDAVEWIRRGYLDFIVPMLYTTDSDAFEQRLDAYLERVPSSKVLAGIGAYLEGFNDSIFVRQTGIAEEKGLLGISVFNSDYALRYRQHLQGK